MKLSLCIAGACALALVGAGCGDDNDTLSYEDTGTEIGTICDSVDFTGLNGEPEHDAARLNEIIPDFEDAIQKVDDLDVDEELASDRDAFVDNAEQQVAVIKEAQTTAESGDKKAYHKKIGETEGLGRESDELASKLGATACIDD